MKDTIIPLTKQLITIPSTKGHTEALHHALEVARAAISKELTIDEFESNGLKSLLIHNQKPGTKHFRVILNAHLDIIQAHEEQFTPVEKDGRLYGRGAYDMKGATSVMIALMDTVGGKLPYPIALQIVLDEEYSGENGTGYQLKQGITAAFAITGECGSNFMIKNQAKGHMALKITTEGVASHGAYPWLGENAIIYMHEVIETLKNLFPTPKEPAWQPTLTISRIETSNKVHNKVPHDCTLHADLRFLAADKDTILEKIKEKLHDKVKVEVTWYVPPHYTDPHDHNIHLLKQALQSEGIEPTVTGAHAASDLRFYTEAGIASVEFGPVGAHQHSDNEWVEIASLEKYYDILQTFLESLEHNK